LVPTTGRSQYDHARSLRQEALAIVPGPKDRVLLASGDHDGAVRLWNPLTGSLAGKPLQGNGGAVTALAMVRLPTGQALITDGQSYRMKDAQHRKENPQLT
jgi:hypothetical protein